MQVQKIQFVFISVLCLVNTSFLCIYFGLFRWLTVQWCSRWDVQEAIRRSKPHQLFVRAGLWQLCRPWEGQEFLILYSQNDLQKLPQKYSSVVTLFLTEKLDLPSFLIHYSFLCAVGERSFQYFRVPYCCYWAYEVQPATSGGGGRRGGRQWLWDSAAQTEDSPAEATDPTQPPAALRILAAQ